MTAEDNNGHIVYGQQAGMLPWRSVDMAIALPHPLTCA